MGAQAAALLASGGPIGIAPTFTVGRTERLTAPAGYLLRDAALSHGGIGLAPWSWDGTAVGTVLPCGTPVRVLPDLTVELGGPADLAPLRRALDLDADLTDLWHTAPQHAGRGWELRATSALEALTQALAATNTSYASSQRMLRELVGDGPFPSPEQVLARPMATWGYRAAALRELAERVDDTDWDALDDDALLAAVRELRGFGPFAAASALPLLGRPRPLVLDGWLASQVEEPRRYEQYGRWGGTVMWLDLSASRARPTRAPAGRRRPAAGGRSS